MGLNKIISVIVDVKGATNMLQQILEPGQKAGKKEEEKVGFWKKFTLLPGFGIMLAIGVVLIGQVVICRKHKNIFTQGTNVVIKKMAMPPIILLVFR